MGSIQLHQWSRQALLPVALFSALSLPMAALSAPVDLTWVGTWTSTGSGNPTGAGGPGLSSGQKYVIKVGYDDNSAVSAGVDILTGAFSPSGQTMQTIDLTGAGNSLDIFVPMEGLDSGSPFIYTQNETNHFPAFTPNPTLNFVDGSAISDPANILGLEFEGNFAPGAGNNIIELFNTAAGASPSPINQVAQILNCGDPSCSSSAPAASGSGVAGSVFADAVDVIADAGPDLVFSAANLTQITGASITQSNDLGAGRSDGEDFLTAGWSVPGTEQADGLNIEVGIAASGLTMTTSTASLTLNVVEDFTGLSGDDSTNVSYANANPTASGSAAATAGGFDFTAALNDADLGVNSLIAGFEMLSSSALVDGTIDASAFFSDLLTTGSQSATNAALAAAFGAGLRTLQISAADKAGGVDSFSVTFDTTGVPPDPIPAPATAALLLLGLALLRRRSV